MRRTQQNTVLFILITVILSVQHLSFAADIAAKLSPAFHKDRLQELFRRCPDGLVLLRGEQDWFRKREIRAFDPAYYEPDFKQERNLYYLTGIEVPNSFVILNPKTGKVQLYSDWTNETELEEVRALGTVDSYHPAAAFLRDARLQAEDFELIYSLYAPFPEDGTLFGKTGALAGVFPPGMGEPVGEDVQFARRLAEIFLGHRIKSLLPKLIDMQKVKHPEEIRLLRRANEISAQGVVAAMKAIRPGLYDHDIAAVIQYEFYRQGATRLTFPSNIMSGPNMFKKLIQLWSGYTHRDRKLGEGEAVILDIGAEVNYYVSDIGRTAPVSGKFTERQRKIYEIYLKCYLETLHSIRPGITQADLVQICAKAMEKQLPELKEEYLRRAAQAFIQSTYDHPALGHYEDMNVLGFGAANDEPLKPGMVFAIEPILYFEEENFAAFVEDVVVVTETGYDVLSKGMPYTVAEIEASMSQASIIDAPSSP